MEVYLVLEEDGTEVDDEEYFQVGIITSRWLHLLQPKCSCTKLTERWMNLQTLERNSMLMLLLKDDIWSPEGPPYM